MCIATAAAIAGIAGAGISAAGAISSGEAQAAQARYQAQVANNNQQTANQNAAYATQAGEAKAADEAQRERQQAGAITASIAANNLDVGSGSAKDVRTSQIELGQQNVERVRQSAALQNYGYRTQATGFGAESTLDRASAGFDTTAGFLKAGGDVLGSAKNLPGLSSLLSGPPTVPGKFDWMTSTDFTDYSTNLMPNL